MPIVLMSNFVSELYAVLTSDQIGPCESDRRILSTVLCAMGPFLKEHFVLISCLSGTLRRSFVAIF